MIKIVRAKLVLDSKMDGKGGGFQSVAESLSWRDFRAMIIMTIFKGSLSRKVS